MPTISLKFDRGRLGYQVRRFLKENKMTQQEVAGLTGLSQGTISKIIKGHRVLSDKVAIICYYLDIDVRDYVVEIYIPEKSLVQKSKYGQVG